MMLFLSFDFTTAHYIVGLAEPQSEKAVTFSRLPNAMLRRQSLRPIGRYTVSQPVSLLPP
jgi:hypothetical protein